MFTLALRIIKVKKTAGLVKGQAQGCLGNYIAVVQMFSRFLTYIIYKNPELIKTLAYLVIYPKGEDLSL